MSNSIESIYQNSLLADAAYINFKSPDDKASKRTPTRKLDRSIMLGVGVRLDSAGALNIGQVTIEAKQVFIK